MQIADRIKADVASAMKAGERDRVAALRLVLSELQKAEKDGQSDELAVLRRERKRRREAAEAYREAAREDLAAGEDFEAQIIEARGFLTRLIGLAGRADLPPDTALHLPRCRSVHTFGMRFPLDLVWLDAA